MRQSKPTKKHSKNVEIDTMAGEEREDGESERRRERERAIERIARGGQ